MYQGQIPLSPGLLDLRESSRFDLEHCYQTHIFDESWDHRNMAGYRIFHMKILTLRTNKSLISRVFYCVRAGMLGFFLALLTRLEIDF